jgi:ATP-binding cassette subfamily B protein
MKQGTAETRVMTKENFRQVMSLYRGRGGKLFLSAFWLVVKHSPAFVTPVVIANIINIVTDPSAHDMSEFWLNLGIGAFFVIQNVFSAWMFARTYSGLTRGVEMELRSSLIQKLQHLSIHFHTEAQSGRLLSKVMRDVENVEQMLNNFFSTSVSFLMSITVAVTVTAVKSPKVLWLYLFAVPVAGITVGAFRKSIRTSNRRFRREMEQTQAAVNEMLEMVPVTRAYGLNDLEAERITTMLAGVRDSGYRLDTTNTVFGAASWVVFQTFQIICLGFTGFLAYRRMISVGEVVLYQNYFGQIVTSVSGVVNLFPILARGMESVSSINEVLAADDLEHSGTVPAPVPLRGEVEFKNVTFRYQKNGPEVLKNFSLHVPAGMTVAFAGSSGAGKSTLLNLLVGFGQPEEGHILIDGIDLSELDLKSYRSQIAVVPQNTILFSGTLRENISYACPEASEKEVMDVIEKVGLSDVVEALPDGLESNLAEHGNNLSGGQRQRISIARALIRRPRLIIFDEATSALDSETEKVIQKATDSLMGECTVFMVAHRLSTIRDADLIVVVEAGRIAEMGTYEELMEKKGRFYRLNTAQFEGTAAGKTMPLKGEENEKD